MKAAPFTAIAKIEESSDILAYRDEQEDKVVFCDEQYPERYISASNVVKLEEIR